MLCHKLTCEHSQDYSPKRRPLALSLLCRQRYCSSCWWLLVRYSDTSGPPGARCKIVPSRRARKNSTMPNTAAWKKISPRFFCDRKFRPRMRMHSKALDDWFECASILATECWDHIPSWRLRPSTNPATMRGGCSLSNDATHVEHGHTLQCTRVLPIRRPKRRENTESERRKSPEQTCLQFLTYRHKLLPRTPLMKEFHEFTFIDHFVCVDCQALGGPTRCHD